MPLTLELPDSELPDNGEAALKAKAQALGASGEQ
jgi:hypothetical protein